MSFERGKNIKKTLKIGVEAEKKRCKILVLDENDFKERPNLEFSHDNDMLFLYSNKIILPIKKIHEALDSLYVIVCYGDQMRIIKKLDAPASELEKESCSELVQYTPRIVYPRKKLNSCIYYFASLYDRWGDNKHKLGHAF